MTDAPRYRVLPSNGAFGVSPRRRRPRRNRRFGLAALLAGALVVGVALPAGALGSWGATTNLFTNPAEFLDPQIAVSADGGVALAAWESFDGTRFTIRSRVGTVSGNTIVWSPFIVLSPAGDGFAPSIALSSDGTRASVVWYGSRSGSPYYVVQSRSATISGNIATWGPNTRLSANDNYGYGPKISLSSDGSRATAVWYRNYGGSDRVQTRSATIAGTAATWGPTTTLSATGGNALGPEVRVASDGSRATVVWTRSDAGDYRVQSRSATIDGTTTAWGPTANLSPKGTDARDDRIAMAADGSRAIAAWYDEVTRVIHTRAATITGSTATWGAMTTHTQVYPASNPQIAMAADGSRASVVWVRNNITDKRVQSRSATLAGAVATWGAMANVSPVDRIAQEPQLGLSSDGGTMTVAWSSLDISKFPYEYRVQARVATVAGTAPTWGATQNLSPIGNDPHAVRVAVSASGTRATALWCGTEEPSILRARAAN